MSGFSSGIAAVAERLREFERMAAQLDMPTSERLGILNVSEAIYQDLRAGNSAAFEGLMPQLERRLSYALPLMRRLAGNNPPTGAGSSKNDPTLQAA